MTKCVGVLVPTYNHALFVYSRVLSILEQSFQEFHIYIIDDGSSDNSFSILKQFEGDKRVTLLRSEIPSGSPFSYYWDFFTTKNHEYWWIAESDDLAEPNLLKSLVDVLNCNSTLSYAFCSSIIIDNRNNITGSAITYLETHFPEVNWKQNQIINKESGLSMLSKGQIVPNLSSLLFRTSSLNIQELKRIKKFKLAGDWFFVILLQCQGGGYYLTNQMNYFRYHETTARLKTDSLSKATEFLYCNFIAWENSLNRNSLLFTIQDTLAMARKESVKTLDLIVRFSRISKSALLRLTRELAIELLENPNKVLRILVRRSGTYKKVAHVYQVVKWASIGKIRHILFLFGVAVRRLRHYRFLLRVIMKKIVNLNRYSLHVISLLILEPKLAISKIRKKLFKNG
jgi:glycosyltransferase involved in cell wall biosynthesis